MKEKKNGKLQWKTICFLLLTNWLAKHITLDFSTVGTGGVGKRSIIWIGQQMGAIPIGFVRM